MRQILATLLLIGALVPLVSSHGRLMEPPQRSSMWRDDRFSSQVPPNYDDGGLWCAGIKQDLIPQACGVCGDPLSDPTPRPNELGGTYGLSGLSAGNYTKGQTIPIAFELTAVHDGYVSLQICDGQEVESCFWNRPFLPLAGGTDRIDVTGLMGFVNTTAALPSDLTCLRCTLRVYYRTAKDWGDCEDGTSGMGCGPQELILNCADISIA